MRQKGNNYDKFPIVKSHDSMTGLEFKVFLAVFPNYKGQHRRFAAMPVSKNWHPDKDLRKKYCKIY